MYGWHSCRKLVIYSIQRKPPDSKEATCAARNRANLLAIIRAFQPDFKSSIGVAFPIVLTKLGKGTSSGLRILSLAGSMQCNLADVRAVAETSDSKASISGIFQHIGS